MKYILLIAFVAIAITGSFAEDDKVKDLLKRGNELLSQAQEAIDLLHKNKRTLEAKRLEDDVPVLKKVMEQIQHEKDAQKLNILEHELKLLEDKITFEIKLAHMDLPDQKEKLLEHARQLVQRADEAQKYLSEHKRSNTQEARNIAKHEAELKALIYDIEHEKDLHKMISLEIKMLHLEADLDREIFNVYHHSEIEAAYNDIVVEIDAETLKKEVARLDEQIKEDIKKLDSENHHTYTQNLVTIEKHVAELSDKLDKIGNKTNGRELNHLELDYLMLRNQYHHERNTMQRLIHNVEELEKHAEELVKKIQVDLEKLHQKNMTADAEDLQMELDLLNVLLKDMKNDTSVEALQHAATMLRGIEMSVDRKLHYIERKLNPHH